MKTRILIATLLASLSFAGIVNGQSKPSQTEAAPSAAATVLNATEAQKIFPGSVFFKGQTAPTQGRNSGGVRLANQKLVLFSLVDNSGYSSQDQGKYQAYLLTEAPLEIDGHKLPAGAYGCGFTSGDSFVVMDISGHDLFQVHASHDADMRRPIPLQVQAAGDSYKLYAGRNFVTFQIGRD